MTLNLQDPCWVFFETNQKMHKVLLGVPILLKWTSVCICGICISMYMWSLVTLRNSLVHFNVLFLTSRMLFRGFWIQCKAFYYISDSEYDLLKKKIVHISVCRQSTEHKHQILFTHSSWVRLFKISYENLYLFSLHPKGFRPFRNKLCTGALSICLQHLP